MTQTINPCKDLPKQRILAIDALRGFDMIWILGLEGIFVALYTFTHWPLFQKLTVQMQHSHWHGLTAYDVIFPLFIFLSGVSLGLSAKPINRLTTAERVEHYQRAIKRFFLLIVLGIIYNHGWGQGLPITLEQIRITSVLAKIAIAWFVSLLIVWHCSIKQQLLIVTSLLVVYQLMLQFVTIGGFGGGQYGMETALNVWFDQHWLPGAHYKQLTIDPEGFLSNVSSISNAIIGVLIGKIFKQYQTQQHQLVKHLVLITISLFVLGYLWSFIVPINKTLWTPSFVLLTSSISCGLLLFFYVLIDVWQWKRFGRFFAVIGINSITIYLMSSLLNWQYTVDSLLGQLIHALPLSLQPLASVLCLVMLQWIFLWWLDKRKIYIKV
jgi:predicted acyltransferase